MGPKRWRVWQDYMTDYCRSDVFIHIWNWNDAESLSVTNQLDSNFEQFFLSIQKEMPAAQPKSYGYLLEREHRALTGSKPAS
jgi:hypothetical protein